LSMHVTKSQPPDDLLINLIYQFSLKDDLQQKVLSLENVT
jgi:hypothetical protein